VVYIFAMLSACARKT